MATIDKIYMSRSEMTEFLIWALENQDQCQTLTGYFLLNYPYQMSDETYVTNFPEAIDWYLWHNCQLPFIQARLKEQYQNAPENELLTLIETLKSKLGDSTPDIVAQLRENIDAVHQYLVTEAISKELESEIST